MMNDLLWWNGITPDTPLRDIGWSYVFVLGLLALAVHFLCKGLKL
jgi:hypothetical protein